MIQSLLLAEKNNLKVGWVYLLKLLLDYLNTNHFLVLKKIFRFKAIETRETFAACINLNGQE